MKGIHGVIFPDKSPVLHYAAGNTKFIQENVCRETDDYLVHFDGVLLSHAKPQRENERFDLLIGLYEQHGGAMAAQLRGRFQLVIWDKRNGRVLVTNDLLSRRPMYGCIRQGALYYASSYYDLLDLLAGEADGCAKLNMDAVREMIARGSLAGTKTYVQDVFFLAPGEALVCDGAVRRISCMPAPQEAPKDLEQAIERFDRLFEQAVRAQFHKNEEYGCRQFVSISGGMDSRACLLMAARCALTENAVCISYAQSGSVDHQVSQQLAFDHDLDYLFYPMDAAVFMKRFDHAMDRNECQQSCVGSTGAAAMAGLLNTQNAGIIHAGLCGGELMGDLVECHPRGGLVRRVLQRLGLADVSAGECRTDAQAYWDNVRACQNFSQMFLSECETFSPFLHEDVALFVCALKPEWLYRRAFYRRWMIRCIPNDYPTTMFCGPVNISPLRELVRKMADRLVRKAAGVTRRDMNPIELWLKTRPEAAKACEMAYLNGMAQLKRRQMPETVLGELESSWRRGGECRLYTLTAVRALCDVLSRFSNFEI